MRKCRFIKLSLLWIYFFSSTIFSQINNDFYFNSLFYTCKVWGYLKYFHTSNADKLLNWDDVLIKNLPELKKISQNEEFNTHLNKYFDQVGAMQISLVAKPVVPTDLRYNLNTDWFTNDNFTVVITNKLKEIEDKFRPRNNYYVQTSAAGNPNLSYDNQYYSEQSTTEELRLLGLFRYWNIINYFYPYKNILDKKWDDVLKEMIPKIINCKNEVDYNKVIMELAGNLNDAHAFTRSSVITNNITGNYYLPVVFKYINKQTVVSKVGSGLLNIKAGDVIKSINNVSIEKCRNNIRPITDGSNPASLERNINTKLITYLSNNSPVDLEIENEKGISRVSIYPISGTDYQKIFTASGPSWKIVNQGRKKFGLINMELLEVSQVPLMFGELWGCDALIFDVRNYPLGTMWYMINYLFPAKIMVARFTAPDMSYPGTLTWAYAEVGSGDFSKNYKKRIYLLFDEETQSQAEYTIMALEQHPMAVKIGSQTAGADGNVSYMYLPGGIQAVFTGLGVFYPDYRPTQRIGIVPDIYIVPTIKGIREGKDEVLEAAYRDYFGPAWPTVLPTDFSLSQNYPNPFNLQTTIEYSIPDLESEASSSLQTVSLKVYDLLGREVKTIFNDKKEPGFYRTEFDARELTSGVYFYSLIRNGVKLVKKMMLVK